MANRREIASILKQAGVSYLSHKGFSCIEELGLSAWGKLRGDVVGLNSKRRLFVLECKSCISDYKLDSKWIRYLPLCNQFAFVFTPKTWELVSVDSSRFKEHGVGVLILDPDSGYLTSVLPAKNRAMDRIPKRDIIVRMAMRNGISRRNTRRKRYYISES